MFARLLATALVLLVVAPPAFAHATEQGVYEGCSPGDTPGALDRCTGRLARIRAAGFDVVLNYSSWYSSEANLAGYAGAAERLGLKLIWPLNGAWWRDAGDNLAAHYPDLAATCHCGDDAGFTAYVAALTRGRAATWGWYVGDELPPAERPAAVALSNRIRQLDPGHPQLLISQETASSAGANLAPFAGLTEYAGADVYPIGNGQPPDTVSTVGAGVRRVVDGSGGRVAIVLQAFSFAAYPQLGRPNAPWPSAAEMRTMRDQALSAARPDLLLWYSAHDILDRSPDPDGLFGALAWAATAPPAISVDGAGVSGRAATVSFHSDAAGGGECRMDGGGWQPCTSPFRAGRLAVGAHTVELRARDLLDRTGQPVSHSVTVAPAVISRLRAPRTIRRRRAGRRPPRASSRGPWVSFYLDRDERVLLAFTRRGRRVTLAVQAHAGRNRIAIPARVAARLRPGRWRLRISAEGARSRSRPLVVRPRRRIARRR